MPINITSTTATTGTLIYTNPVPITSDSQLSGVRVEKKSGMPARIYFEFIKKKLSVLEGVRLNNRISKLEKAFDKAVEDGQNALADKFFNQCVIEGREALMYTKGIRMFIERDIL